MTACAIRSRSDGDSLVDMYRNTRGAAFGAEVKRRIMLGTYVLSHWILRRVLQESAAGADADHARFQRGI